VAIIYEPFTSIMERTEREEILRRTAEGLAGRDKPL
jgi:hypothetical protein